MKTFKEFSKDEKGATAVEYGLIVGLIAVVLIVAVTFLGGNVTQTFDRIRCELSGGDFKQPSAWTAGTLYETDKHYYVTSGTLNWCSKP